MIKWHDKGATIFIDTKSSQVIFAMGEILKDVIVQGSSRTQPISPGGRGLDPSKPGEYPKRVTDEFMKGVVHEHRAEIMTSRVGTNVPHGRWLQFGTSRMAARPWLTLGIMEAIPLMKASMKVIP